MHDLTPDPAAIGVALLKLLVTQQMLGHESPTGTCLHYVNRSVLDAPERFVWDVAVSAGVPNDDVRTARARVKEWAQETPWMHAVAEAVAAGESRPPETVDRDA